MVERKCAEMKQCHVFVCTNTLNGIQYDGDRQICGCLAPTVQDQLDRLQGVSVCRYFLMPPHTESMTDRKMSNVLNILNMLC